MEPIIELTHVSKTFHAQNGEVEALKDISLAIEKGDIFGIIGLSGAGKSTLVKALLRLKKYTGTLFESAGKTDGRRSCRKRKQSDVSFQ